MALLNFMGFVQAHLSTVQVPLDDIPSLQHLNLTTQVGVIRKLRVHLILLSVKNFQSQY